MRHAVASVASLGYLRLVGTWVPMRRFLRRSGVPQLRSVGDLPLVRGFLMPTHQREPLVHRHQSLTDQVLPHRHQGDFYPLKRGTRTPCEYPCEPGWECERPLAEDLRGLRPRALGGAPALCSRAPHASRALLRRVAYGDGLAATLDPRASARERQALTGRPGACPEGAHAPHPGHGAHRRGMGALPRLRIEACAPTALAVE